MKFIYAKRPQPQLEFGTANRLDAVPVDAEVFAVCDGALLIRRQLADPQAPLTNQEEAKLEALIAQSQMLESTASATGKGQGVLSRLIGRLLNL